MIVGGSEELPKVVSASEVQAKIKAGQPAEFDNSTIVGDLNLSALKFYEQVHFNNSHFLNLVIFKSTSFNGTAYFGHSTFNSTADFNGSKFNGTAHFEYSNFNRDAYFEYSKFNSDAYFWYSKFNGTAYFIYSKFNNYAVFTGSTFSKEVFFLGAHLKSLDLTLSTYEKMYIRWSSLEDLYYDDEFGDTTYQLLVENFNKLGFLQDADNCYSQFRWEECLHQLYRRPFKDPLMFLLNLGAGIFYGYGKKPLLPLYWSSVFILLFGAIWRIGGRRKHKYTSPHIPQKLLWDRDWRSELRILAEATVFSATVFLSGTKLFVDPPEIPRAPRWSRLVVKVMFNFERVMGAFFFVLFILAISGTVVR